MTRQFRRRSLRIELPPKSDARTLAPDIGSRLSTAGPSGRTMIGHDP
jgi:hypothetical protein